MNADRVQAEPLLQISHLRAGYSGADVLHDISLAIAGGEAAALLGANGAGKTTLLRSISGMIRSTGSMRFAGRELGRLSAEQIAGMGVAHVPEGRGTFMSLSVEENIRLGTWLRRDAEGIRQDRDWLLGLFPRLQQRLAQQAGTLSGGEQQMLAIVRALMSRPRLLLLDEPSFGLAPKLVAEVFATLSKIRIEHRVAMLIVEQHVGLALDLADHAYLIADGRIVRSGPTSSFRDDAALQAAYLGA